MFRKLKDPISGLAHLTGALLSIAGLCLLVVAAVEYGGARHVVSFTVFGASMVLLYAASTLYHLLPLSSKGERVLRQIDHIMIFVLIAGTYTPVCLVPLKGPWGWSLFGVVWGITFAGIFLKLFWIEAPRWLAVTIYLIMGWAALVAVYPIVITIPVGGLVWMVLGGVFYSGGAVFYGLKWPNPFPEIFGFHEIWHLFVMAGTFSHFWMMYKYVVHIG